jgi:hypothetical protein
MLKMGRLMKTPSERLMRAPIPIPLMFSGSSGVPPVPPVLPPARASTGGASITRSTSACSSWKYFFSRG